MHFFFLGGMQILRAKLITTAFLTQALVLALFLFGMNRVVQTALADNSAASARQRGEVINLAVAPYLSQGRQEVLRDYLFELLAGKGGELRYIVVLTESGQLVLRAGDLPDETVPAPSASTKGLCKRYFSCPPASFTGRE